MIYHGSAFYEPTLGHLFYFSFFKCTKQKVMKFTHVCVCVSCVASVCELMHCYIILHSLPHLNFYVHFFGKGNQIRYLKRVLNKLQQLRLNGNISLLSSTLLKVLFLLRSTVRTHIRICILYACVLCYVYRHGVLFFFFFFQRKKYILFFLPERD